jgi:hypothetical protein
MLQVRGLRGSAADAAGTQIGYSLEVSAPLSAQRYCFWDKIEKGFGVK